MSCQRCLSNRIMSVTGKCNDTCGVSINGIEHEGYLPKDIGIGGGDYIEFSYCLECGQIQNKFPKDECDLETLISESDFREFYDNYFTAGQIIDRKHLSVLRVVRVAEEYGMRFENFIDLLIDQNDRKKIPPVNILWIMLQKNQTYIE